MNRLLFLFLFFCLWAFPNEAIDNGVSITLPVRVVLGLPPNNEALFDADMLSKSLSAFRKHSVPFYTGEMFEDSFLNYNIDWQVSMLPQNNLQELENQIKKQIQEVDNSGSAPGQDKLFHEVAVDVGVVDGYLNDVAETLYSGETVIFVIAPRKGNLFGDHRRRRHYHYQGYENSGKSVATGLDCVSTWVGQGRFLVTDLAAGPCTWGSSALVSGPLMPYIGDGSQGPSSLTEALGFVSNSFTFSAQSEEIDTNEEEDGSFDENVFEVNLSRILLSSQVTSLLTKAVKYLLCPALGRESDVLAAYVTDARHLAVVPAHLLVPVIVITPNTLPAGMTEHAFLESVINLTELETILQETLPFSNVGVVEGEKRATVFGAVHTVTDHPEISTAIASSLRFHTLHRVNDGSEEVQVEEVPCLDAQVLHASMFESHSGLTTALLSDAGLLNQAFGDTLSDIVQGEDRHFNAKHTRGKEVVLPVVIMSDVATHRIGPNEYITGFGKHQTLSTSFGDRAVFALHSSDKRITSQPLTQVLSGSHGGGDTNGVGKGKMSFDPSDCTSHVAAAILTGLTGISPPPLDASLMPKHRIGSVLGGVGVKARTEHSDFSWAVGHHPFMPFSLGKARKKSNKLASSHQLSDRHLHVSPIYKDVALRGAIAANVRMIKEELDLFEKLIFEFEDTVSKGMTSDWLVTPGKGLCVLSRLKPTTPGLKRRSLKELLAKHVGSEESVPLFVLESVETARSSLKELKLKYDGLTQEITASSTNKQVVQGKKKDALQSVDLSQILLLVSELYASTKQGRLRHTLTEGKGKNLKSSPLEIENTKTVLSLDKALGLWKECCSLEFKVVSKHHSYLMYVIVFAVLVTMALVGLLAWWLRRWARINRHSRRVGTERKSGGAYRF